MSFVRFLTGASSLLVMIGALAWGGRRMRARWLPEWSGATALLADVVLVWSGLFVTSYVLGAVGLFRPVSLVGGCVIAGVGVGLLAGAPKRARVPVSAPVERRSGAEVALAIVAVALVVVTWAVATGYFLPDGIRSFDSVQYHLPRAARFAQDGWLTHLHPTGPEFPDAFHPVNAEVVHAIGMMLFRLDLLSPVVNLVWLACLLLAGWCFGASVRREPLTLAAIACVAALPTFASDQAATAANDVAAMFFLVAGAALLLQTPVRPAAIAVAAFASGLAAGTKLTVLAAVAALTIGVVVIFVRTHGARSVWAWFVPLLTTGGFWYVRNVFATGSPLPGVRVSIGGLLLLPYGGFALVDVLGYRVARYALDVDVWRVWLLPALSRYLGPAWWLLLAFVACGTVLSWVATRSAVMRLLGIVALVSFVAYTLTPTSGLGLDGQPFLFEANLVYAMPTVALTVLLLAVTLPVASAAARAAVIATLLLGVAVGQLSEKSPWQRTPVHAGVVVAVVVVVVFAALCLRARSVLWRVVLAGALSVAGWFAAGWYAHHRYADDPLAQWASSMRGARIAESGLSDQYRLYDAGLTNHVAFVGDRGPHGAIHHARSCTQWRTALRRGAFDHVVLRHGDYSTNSPADEVEVKLGLSSVGERELQWMRYDPAASETLRMGRIIIYDFDPRVPDPGC